MNNRLRLLAPTSACIVLVAGLAAAYPLDGYGHTGIRRLWAYDPELREELGGPALPAGALHGYESVRLHLLDQSDYDVDTTDPELQAGLEGIFADRDGSYSIAVLDITDPSAPRYGALRETTAQLPGSVGKLLVTTGVFDALARSFPEPADRLEILRGSWIVADDFSQRDSHSVPIVDVAARTLTHRPIRIGDGFTLFEWLDHALSPSANAAGATAWREAMILREFGARYPVPADEWQAWLAETPKTELTELSLDTLEAPLRAVGLDTTQLRQGTMFTTGGRAHVPGVRSLASPKQLLRMLLRIEQGLLVDEFSSLEIKRLMYFTRRRYRYAVSPALNDAAVYFKSGSFYRCVDEEGFECRQYAGNSTNIMNSVAIIENPAVPQAGERQRVYLVALTSNVLRKNSAEDHRDLATEIDRLIAGLNR
ncbi:MAG: hypothetical protein GKS06_13680 [Acidobacteria bacterium]|nr:hypothetical protein [Acidobacteriota bacterium]